MSASARMRNACATLLTIGLLALALSGCDFLRGYASGRSSSFTPFDTQSLSPAERGAARFIFGDFGALDTDTLETNAVPWKLITTALVLERWPAEPPTQKHLRAILTGFGFLYPQRIGNWPLAEQPRLDAPLGIVSGAVTRAIPKVEIEVANLGCASCHSGTTYDSQGEAVPVAWLGLPNTSLDLDAYVDGVMSSLRAASADRDRLLGAVTQLYPRTSEAEIKSLRKFVWPRLIARLQGNGAALPFRNGGPGRSNGVAALKFQLGLALGEADTAAGVSIPDLGDQTLRRAVLTDGIYTRVGDLRFGERTADTAAEPAHLAEMVAFFTVPTMGLHPDRAVHAIAAVGEVLGYLAGYRAPAFPGPIDAPQAARGAQTYASHCAKCHGEYAEHAGQQRLVAFPNLSSSAEDIGTDPQRVNAVDGSLIAAVERSPMGRYIDAERTGGYVAPSLSGIWATAPYLHNGSVPTLAQLLNPNTRPQRFWVGGHKLDFSMVGIAGQLDDHGAWAYPAGYRPWSTPRLFDTFRPGCSNRGHEREFEALTSDEKSDVLEYLKRL